MNISRVLATQLNFFTDMFLYCEIPLYDTCFSTRTNVVSWDIFHRKILWFCHSTICTPIPRHYKQQQWTQSQTKICSAQQTHNWPSPYITNICTEANQWSATHNVTNTFTRLTNATEQCPSSEANSSSGGNKIPYIVWKPKFITVFITTFHSSLS